MSDREYWTGALRKAERELDAARTRTALDAAAKKLMLAKTELMRLEAKPGRLTGGHGAVTLSSPSKVLMAD